MNKPLTLVFVLKNNQVLLGMKKRGFGAGWWNGFGGKLHANESIEDAAKRELLEEASVTAVKLKSRGLLEFTFDDSPDTLIVSIFECTEYTGEPVESEEMLPQWFNFNDLPFDKMWPDDKFWLPKFLKGEQISGKFHFDKDKKIVKYELK